MGPAPYCPGTPETICYLALHKANVAPLGGTFMSNAQDVQQQLLVVGLVCGDVVLD